MSLTREAPGCRWSLKQETENPLVNLSHTYESNVSNVHGERSSKINLKHYIVFAQSRYIIYLSFLIQLMIEKENVKVWQLFGLCYAYTICLYNMHITWFDLLKMIKDFSYQLSFSLKINDPIVYILLLTKKSLHFISRILMYVWIHLLKLHRHTIFFSPMYIYQSHQTNINYSSG